MDQGMFTVSGAIPATLPLLSPAQTLLSESDNHALASCALGSESGPDGSVEEKCDASAAVAERLLSVAAGVYSKWFMLMRSIMTRERVATRLAHEEETKKCYGELPYSRFPCEPQPLTANDVATVDICELAIRYAFGEKTARYAKECFYRAIRTGDKRSFKIRLLFFKSRDGLKDTPVYDPFSAGLDEYISISEESAGCIPDPTPRRLSLEEQRRKKAKESKFRQMDLFSQEDQCQEKDIVNSLSTEIQYLDIDKLDNRVENKDVSDDTCAVSPSVPEKSVAPGGEKRGVFHNDVKDDDDPKIEGNTNVEGNVTVTGFSSDGSKRRKTKVYEKVSEIVEDIESGAIAKYEAIQDILSDMKSGYITAREAVLFLAELKKRSQDSFSVKHEDEVMGEFVGREDSMLSKGMDDIEDELNEDDLGDGEDMDGDEDDEDEEEDSLPSERRDFSIYGGDYDEL